jgi:hypothetical protein
MTDADELIDYEEDEVMQTPAKTLKDATATSAITTATKDSKKSTYVGKHSTGFRDFLLKPELLRAIVDCGFEHPSEGTHILPFPSQFLYLKSSFDCHMTTSI